MGESRDSGRGLGLDRQAYLAVVKNDLLCIATLRQIREQG